MYDPIHASRHGVVSVPRNVRGYERRRYDDEDGAAEETTIGPRLNERAGYQK